MTTPPFRFGDVVDATERLQCRLRDAHSRASNIQGIMAILQLLSAVLLNVLVWARPMTLEAWLAAPGSLMIFGLLVFWHGMCRATVISPLPYAVLLLQCLIRWGLGESVLVNAITFLMVLLATAVNQRSLENCVHEASHHTLYRSALLNGCSLPGCKDKVFVAPSDRLEQVQQDIATMFAAMVFKDIQAYHESHSIHHRHFGNAALDPDYSIYERTKVTRGMEVARATLCWYWDNFHAAAEFTSQVARRSGWRLALAGLVAAVAALVGSAEVAELTSVWVLAYLFVLPPLRMIAEQEEHARLIPDREAFVAWMKQDPQYLCKWDQLDAEEQNAFVNEHLGKLQWTMSRTNAGRLHRWVFHPCGDGWHAVHHLSARVPFYRLQAAHQELEAMEPIFKALCHRNTALITCAFDWRRI